MKKSLISLALLVSACITDAPDEFPGGLQPLRASNYTEYWEEQKNPNVLYYVGSNFEWRFSRDSIEMVQNAFTDASMCTLDLSGQRTCTPFRWSHHYAGTYQRQDSTLSMQVHHHHSEPENAPEVAIHAIQAVIHLSYSADSTEMTATLVSGNEFFNSDSPKKFRKLEHGLISVVSAEVSNDCGPADGAETRLTFNTAPCPHCPIGGSGQAAPYSLYLGYEDVDQIASGNIRHANTWRCDAQGCTDSAEVKVEFSKVTADSVSGRITLRNGMKRGMGLFAAPKKRSRPTCG